VFGERPWYSYRLQHRRPPRLGFEFYDPLGQLISVASSANATSTHDPVGNRKKVTGAVPGAGGLKNKTDILA
jgi:hypothetical protein